MRWAIHLRNAAHRHKVQNHRLIRAKIGDDWVLAIEDAYSTISLGDLSVNEVLYSPRLVSLTMVFDIKLLHGIKKMTYDKIK